MPFKPGQSGNPAGRPRQKPFLDWCKNWAEERGEKYLRQIAENPKHRQQLEAIKMVYAYGFGRPVEFSESTNYDGENTGTDSEILERAAAIRKRMDSLIAGIGQPEPDASQKTGL